MANEVFANDLEIACKAADGKSLCAFPDPCMVTPCPTSPPVIIPLPNTVYAKHIKKGSKSVRISGKEVAKKDKSYFKKSTGNEIAKCKKGLITGTKKGKAYFRSWSMNVKVEGENVCRHTDSITHNHNPAQGNTAVWKYVDTNMKRDVCRDDFRRMQKKCKPTKKGKKGKTIFNKAGGAWKKSYCKGLTSCPPTEDDYDPKAVKEKLNELADTSKITADALQKAKDVAWDAAEDFALKQAGKVVAKAAVKGWLGPIGWVWTAYDIASTGLEVKEIYDKLDKLQEDISKIKKTAEKLKKLANKDDLKPSDMADAQALLAAANPCLRARKCMLVPYKQSEQAGLNKGDSGCCKGQTAHHVIPKGQFKKEPKKNAPAVDSCTGYDENKAPCICTEGTSHSRGGTHQKIHDSLEPKIEKYADSEGELTYEQSRDMAVKSLRESAPSCSAECLKAQLDKYHKKACNQSGDKFKLRAASAKSGKTYDNTDIGE